MAYTNGALAFYRATSKGAHDPQTITALALQHGVPASIIPPYAGDRQQVSRAITATGSKVSRQGWLLRPIKQSRAEVCYAIVREDKDQAAERLHHTQESTAEWTCEHGNGAHVTGSHAIAQQIDTEYQAIRGKILSGDWTGTLTDYLINTCQATAMREDGRIYWIPPQCVAQAHILRAFLAEVGIALVLCEIEAESRETVVQAVHESLAEQLQSLEDQAATFSGDEKPSNYKRRLEEYAALRKRATTYRDALGIGIEQASRVLDRLEEEVGMMLDIRQQTVVHRDGTASAVAVAPARAQAVATLDASPTLSFDW
jgi:adenylate kinase family enzyme